MARNRGPLLRKSRRLGLALDPKSERNLDKRPYPPGHHGKSRRPRKQSNYGIQLQEKQRARFMYDVLERQFRRYYQKATHLKGVVGDNLMSLLEQRLDNTLFRLGFANTRRMARQIVNHGHVQVNGRKVDIPSFQVSVGDIIEVREKAARTAASSKPSTLPRTVCCRAGSRPIRCICAEKSWVRPAKKTLNRLRLTLS